MSNNCNEEMNNILISIIVPVYNMESSLERCINSLLNQTYSNIQIILVDDGSSDNSGLICDLLSEKDVRVETYHTTNRGAGPARNYGIKKAKGDYLYFPDADDYLDEKAFEILINYLKSYSCVDIIVFGYLMMDHNNQIVGSKEFSNTFRVGEKLRSDYSVHMLNSESLTIQGAPWNKLFSSNLILNNNILFPSLRRHQDEAFISLSVNFCENVLFVPDVLYTHYLNNLKLEWNKFPANYNSIVNALFKMRQQTILKWNPNDLKTHNMVYIDCFGKEVRGYELSFSPNNKLSLFEHYNWFKEQVRLYSLINDDGFDTVRGLTLYLKVIRLFLQHGYPLFAYFIISIKARLESICS